MTTYIIRRVLWGIVVLFLVSLIVFFGVHVVGDPVYAGNRSAYGLSGQALHAGTLSFIHPVTGQMLTLTSPVPDTFSKIAEELL